MAGRVVVSTLNNDTGVLATQNGMTGIAKAWVNFNGTGTVAIRDSFNVSSITDNGTGDYTVNFTTAMPNANYAVASTGKFTSNDGASLVFSTSISNRAGNPATTFVRMVTGQGNNGTQLDFEVVCVSVLSS
jgi:hypothetical protein